MNISCEIIKDLLPLYHDGVCSDDSKKLIEEHLAHCEICSKELKAMENDFIAENKQNLSEAEVVKKLSKRWRKGMIKSALKSILFTLVTVAVVLLLLYTIVDVKIS